jgi:chromosome segregation ATPase
MTDIDQLLGAWREEILAEIETMQAELAEKRAALHEAETANRQAKAHQHALRARIAAAVGEGTIATALAMRADEATRDTTSGTVAKLGAEITVLEQKIADHHAALQQIARALQSDDMLEAA